ncbi:hypothetical protein LXL04_034437 [Taraxacum kok-saghyz]
MTRLTVLSKINCWSLGFPKRNHSPNKTVAGASRGSNQHEDNQSTLILCDYCVLFSQSSLNWQRRRTAVDELNMRTIFEENDVICELIYKVREIKTKAEQSETMVQEICRDIKKLDFAKMHITTTITALHRLTMLVIC